MTVLVNFRIILREEPDISSCERSRAAYEVDLCNFQHFPFELSWKKSNFHPCDHWTSMIVVDDDEGRNQEKSYRGSEIEAIKKNVCRELNHDDFSLFNCFYTNKKIIE